MVIIMGIAAVLSTLLGGLFALRFKDKLHLVLGLSAGAVIGVAFFDLIPESLELAAGTYNTQFICTVMALGFVLYLIVDRLIVLHQHHDDGQHHARRSILGAGSLTLHSFLDGAAIGLAFKVSASVGIIVATAVLVHDFSDGINTVSMILKNNGSRSWAYKWLLADAIAPALGIASTFFFSLSQASLGIVLALFAGFFLYIGASELLPESHHAHPARWTTFSTIIGIVVLYVAIQLAGI